MVVKSFMIQASGEGVGEEVKLVSLSLLCKDCQKIKYPYRINAFKLSVPKDGFTFIGCILIQSLNTLAYSFHVQITEIEFL
jgi:hypothetical protein